VKSGTAPGPLQDALRVKLTADRALAKANAQPDAIAKDFSLFSLAFWDEVERLDKRNLRRKAQMKALNDWRNAIAHYDFVRKNLTGRLQIRTVRSWRTACSGLAVAMDEVVATQSELLAGTRPW
jgi:hypothetical protein